jgi:hypothetical protein
VPGKVILAGQLFNVERVRGVAHGFDAFRFASHSQNIDHKLGNSVAWFVQQRM